MWQAHHLHEHTRAKLQAVYGPILNEPLPDRWCELIQHLNEKERARIQARRAWLRADLQARAKRHLAEANRNLAEGKQRVADHKARIARLERSGAGTTHSNRFLDLLEQSLALMVAHREMIAKEIRDH